MSFLRSMPDASLIHVFRTYPELTKPLHEFAHRLLRGPSPFTEGERELLAAYVSRSITAPSAKPRTRRLRLCMDTAALYIRHRQGGAGARRFSRLSGTRTATVAGTAGCRCAGGAGDPQGGHGTGVGVKDRRVLTPSVSGRVVLPRGETMTKYGCD